MSLKSKMLMILASPAGRILPDRLYLKVQYRLLMGHRLNLDSPKAFTEQLQWLKLNDRNPLYHSLVDKFQVKEYVRQAIGDQYVVPILGKWDRAEDIDWDALPDKFVIKCTHDSGSTIVCRDRSSFDYADACRKLSEAMKHDYSWRDREWAYRGLKPRIIAEEYLGDDVPDYKFFCFGGKPEFMYIASDRGVEGEEVKFDFFSMDGEHLPVLNGHPNASRPPELPSMFGRMAELASKLSAGIPHVRVDFYQCSDRIYFGEFTFYHFSGLVPFSPRSTDFLFGSYLDTDKVRKGGYIID